MSWTAAEDRRMAEWRGERRRDETPMTNDCFSRQCRFCKDLDHCNCECHDQERAERAAIEGEDE